MKIYEDKYLNRDAIYLESDKIRLVALKDLGFKIASFYSKERDKEVFTQAKDGFYQSPKYGDRFSRYDNSGLNDMIPTLEACTYPGDEFKGLELVDRGDAWSQPWDISLEDNKLVGRLDLISLPLSLEKTLTFVDENTISMAYSLENLSDKDIYYLWSLQGLNVCDDSVEYILEDDMNFKINVLTHEDLNSFDTKKISQYREDRTYKYFYYGQFKKGRVGLDYKDDRLQYLIDYDPKKLPYLGAYVNKRLGRCSIEPSNSFFDSISVAYDNNTIHEIKAGHIDKWNVNISLQAY